MKYKLDLNNPAAKRTLRRNTARSRALLLAIQYEGRPMREFEQGWERGVLHRGSSVLPHSMSGWRTWAVSRGIMEVNHD